MALFYPLVSGNEKTIISSIMVGSLALGTVGFSHAPRAAFWYLGIHTVTMTLVPLACGLYWGSSPDLLISALAVVAGVAICNAALERARSQMKAFANHESLLHKSEMVDLLLKDYEEQGVEWVWRTDVNGRILTCPQQVLEHISNDEKGNDKFDLLQSFADHIAPQGENDLERIRTAFQAQQEFHDVNLPLFCNVRNSLRWLMVRGRPQFEGEDFVGFRGIIADATSGMEVQKQTEFLAENDALTATFNRNYIQARLDELHPGQDNATAYLIDLDGFKQVNDSYGHAVGDKLLQHVAHRLNEVVGDKGAVSRLGGDEFLILIKHSGEHPHDERVEEKLDAQFLTSLCEPFSIAQYDISISASIGIAHFPSDTAAGSALLNQADLALYAAKKSGRNKSVTFVPSMQEGLQKRLVVTERLRHALRHGQIKSHYQPQFCAKTSRLLGFEALARWTDSELGVVGPDIFIPIAEETGLIHELGENSLRMACKDALTWAVPDGDLPLTVAVNVSPVQVMRGNIVAIVKSVLAETGLPPERLEIEVTEGVLIEDMAGTSQVLGDLAALGVRIALDDFGTGYSSLSYLRALPLHSLKIDRSFIADLAELEAQSVVQTVIDLCRRLDLDVVAEGVETKVSVQTLREMGCVVLQGYYFSRPVPASKVQNLLESVTQAAA